MPDRRENIVVVDDDFGMNQAIENLLDAAGFRALTFRSGEALLESGVAASAACVVLDVHLEGLSGFELRRRLQEAGNTAPVIFITAHEDPGSRAEAQNGGALAFFTKPFPGRNLLDAISVAVRSGSGEGVTG
jgi:FixJ family two-component response regulator